MKILYTRKEHLREVEKALRDYDERRNRMERLEAAEHRIYDLEMRATRIEAELDMRRKPTIEPQTTTAIPG